MTCTALPFICNPFTWYSQHVVEHHCHCNNIDKDADLFHFTPFRLHKEDTSQGSQLEMGKVLLVGLHLGFGVPLNTLTGLLDRLDPAGFPSGTHIKLHEFFRRSISHYLAMWSTVVLALVNMSLSFLVHGTLLQKVCFMALPYSLASLAFIIFTQVSHIQEECQRSEALHMSDFFKAQALTSLDYSCDSKLWSVLSGGLNTQSLHHCLPWVSSCHYSVLYPKFLAVCKQHGILPATAPNLWVALGSTFSYVVKLNSS